MRPDGLLFLALAAAAGCGDGGPAEVEVADVRGAPLRRTEMATPTIGDLDSGRRTGEPPAAVTALVPPPAVPTPAKPVDGDVVVTSFDDLAGFEYAEYASEAKQKHPVPEKVRALSGRTVELDGFMMPLSYEAGGLKKFLLMKFKFGCCYGATPKLNEWIEVTMEGGAVADYEPDTLCTVRGVLDVKEEDKDGVATSLYKMRGQHAELTEAK
jgi:hypothetical protein